MKNQRRAQAFGRGLRLLGEQRGQIRQARDNLVKLHLVHPAHHVGKAADGRVALGNAFERERAVVIVLERVELIGELEMLVLKGVGQFVRQDHLTLHVALRQELGGVADDPGVGRAADQDHALGVGVVEAGDLVLEQPQRRLLQIDPGRIETDQGAALAVDPELLVAYLV